MIKKIYHGSDHIIEHPVFGAGKTYNDYGLGFYCTDTPEMAKEWGVSCDKSGYVELSGENAVYVETSEKTDKEILQFATENENGALILKDGSSCWAIVPIK